MMMCSRNTFKSLFTITCVIVVLCMVGYWLYKYEIEDRDIGVVDYTPLEDANEVELPAVSLCLKNPFLVKQSSTMQNYLGHLNGHLYDDIYESIEYPNMTLDLNQYFKSGGMQWKNRSTQSIVAGSINHVEIFSGFHDYVFVKCFMIRYIGADQRKIKVMELFYDKTALHSDWYLIGQLGGIFISAHYPGQFFLENEFYYTETAYLNNGLLSFKDLEILKRRNSRQRKCLKVENEYDSLVIDQLLFERGCRVPYLRENKDFPKCDNKKKIRDSKIETKEIEKLTIPKACQRISKMRIDFKEEKGFCNQSISVRISYPNEVKIITQSKDVDIHSLIGNIVGYLGLFLGNKS